VETVEKETVVAEIPVKNVEIKEDIIRGGNTND